MTEHEVLARLEIIKSRRWFKDQFIKWYGVDLWASGCSPAAQFKVWASRFDDGSNCMSPDDIDRWKFERFLVAREWLPTNQAALQFGMSVEQFDEVLKGLVSKDLIDEKMIDIETHGIFPSNFLRDLPKRLPSFPRKIFTSHSSYVREFHVAIKKDLGLHVVLLVCEASRFLGDSPPEVAYECDIITSIPISISHQVWLDFGKPLALKPDACSVLTYLRHESLLSEYSMGGPEDGKLESVRNILTRQKNGAE